MVQLEAGEMAQVINQQKINCRVKWFDPKRGFGFLIPDLGGPDILLHANILRAAGCGSVADGARVEAIVSQDGGRWQATAVVSIQSADGITQPNRLQFEDLDADSLGRLPYSAAKVKWFDPSKGSGFANVFGCDEDVFIHVEVLRASGLASLAAGEAVALRVVNGDRGRMAVEITEWSLPQAIDLP